jgi:TolA-binding protein
MRSVSRRRAADHVRPSLSEARVARMWSTIEAGERARRERRVGRARAFVLLAAAALLTALVIVGVGRLRSSPGASMAGLVIDTGAASQDVSLPEGSSLHLGPTTRLRIVTAAASEIRLRLDRGSVLCDVTHREGRRFTVEAERVEVEVRGTRFEVDVDVDPASGPPAAVAVRVERGAVEVREEGRTLVAALSPGQSWQSRGLDGDGAAKDPGAEERPDAEPAPPASASAVAPPAAPPASAAPTRGGALSPRLLFERANAARLAGRNADAAADFERFGRLFPSDPRAGLAAYELGRIRLGSLGDARGAAEAFSKVIKRDQPGAGDPFREDAEAGRVEALSNLGDLAACKKARDAFTARYPSSPQATRVARLCGAP